MVFVSNRGLPVVLLILHVTMASNWGHPAKKNFTHTNFPIMTFTKLFVDSAVIAIRINLLVV